ncbi:unnamed protein product, partial [Rotaria sordida]
EETNLSSLIVLARLIKFLGVFVVALLNNTLSFEFDRLISATDIDFGVKIIGSTCSKAILIVCCGSFS